MFRIDKNLVNLATARSVQVDGEETVAGAEGVPLNASASVAYMNEEAVRKAQQKADKIIEDAQNEAATLMLSAREQAEEDRRRAWQEGYTEGSLEGKRVCEEKYEQKRSQDDATLERVIEEIYDERKRTFDALEENVVGLALEIVKKVYAPAEELFGGVFESLIRNALRQIAPEGKVIIRVSSAEYERFFSSGSAVFHLDKGVTVTASVLRDASLSEGDCIIDTEDETVNAGLDTQLKYINIAFKRSDE